MRDSTIFSADRSTRGNINPDGEEIHGTIPLRYSGGALVERGGEWFDDGWSSDRDWYAVELVSNTNYRIDLWGQGDGTADVGGASGRASMALVDPHVSFYSGSRESPLNQNDDGGIGNNSLLSFTTGNIGNTGVYYIEVRSVEPRFTQCAGKTTEAALQTCIGQNIEQYTNATIYRLWPTWQTGYYFVNPRVPATGEYTLTINEY